MGKSKKRSFNKNINDDGTVITRLSAIKRVVNLLKNGDKKAYSLISMFGLSAEEILEGGASVELVKGLDNILKWKICGFG